MSTSKESKPVTAKESKADGTASKRTNSSAFLYDELSFGAVKICDISAKYLLPGKANRI